MVIQVKITMYFDILFQSTNFSQQEEKEGRKNKEGKNNEIGTSLLLFKFWVKKFGK